MGHNCQHHHHSTGNFRTAFFLNLSFTIIEIFGGIISGSLAILSDAIHDLGDTLAIGIAWAAEKFSNKKPNENFTFGLKRFKVISALLNGAILLIGSIGILTFSIQKWLDDTPADIKVEWMLGLAILGVVFNGSAVLRLKKQSGVNARVMRLHLLEDALGWIAVLVGSIVIYFTGWTWIDVLLSVLLSLYIGYNAALNLYTVYEIVMEKSTVQVPELKEKIETIPEVIEICDLHTWTIDGEHHIGTLHILSSLTDTAAQAQLKQQIRQTVNSFGSFHLTIEVEHPDFPCNDSCN